MKKLILLALTTLTLMACADNGVSAPGADEPSNNGNCYEKELSYYDVQTGKEFNAYFSEWVKPHCSEWSETNPDICVRFNNAGTTIVKICE